MEKIGAWLGGNWGWVIAIFCVFFEIAPIKLHPISSFLGWLGKKLTGDIRKDIADLREDVDRQRMANIRSLVLDFSNTCLNGRRHTKEEFDHILAENHNYETLVQRYGISNDVYSEAYSYILRIYRNCLDSHTFLTTHEEERGSQHEAS